MLDNEVNLLKWNRVQLLQAKDNALTFDEKMSFDDAAFANYEQIKRVDDVRAYGEIKYDVHLERIFVSMNIEGTMIVPCAITLEDIEFPFETEAYETFGFEASDEEFLHVMKGDVVEVLPIIFQLILMEAPLKVVKKGIKYPKGKGWEVVKETKAKPAEKQKLDPRLAKLKQFKFDDE